jgi:spore photoproduct lyase
MKYKPDFILIDRLVEHLPATQRILDKFKCVDTTVIEDVRAIKKPVDFSAAKKTLLITRNNGSAFKPCQGITPGHLCCNYWIIDLISNCPLDCSYCILQEYLQNNPLLTIYTNIDEILTRASMYIAERRDKKFRVGTGELSDSLALDHVTGFSKKLIEYFSCQPNVTLELKTKTANINHLLKLNHNGRTVIAWSVSPQRFIDEEEVGTASLEARFDAAKTVIHAGYSVAFHFDPVVLTENWEAEYKEVVEKIVQMFPAEKIAWISLGTLRFPHEMKDIVMKRFPKSKIFYNEFVPVNGKVRYFRPIREGMYKKILSWFAPIKETVPIYLCMETKTVWQKIMPEVSASNRAIEEHVCGTAPTCHQF